MWSVPVFIGFLLASTSLFDFCYGFNGITNLALNKGATSKNLTDGNYFTITNGTADSDGGHYLRLNLDGEFHIRNVKIFIQPDSWLGDFTMMTSTDSAPSAPSYAASQWDIVYYVRGVVDRNITIPLYLNRATRNLALYSRSQPISVTEIEVYDYDVTDRPINRLGPSNIKAVSPTSSLANSSRAVDGNYDMSAPDSFFQASDGEINNWWQVELKEDRTTTMLLKIYPYLERHAANTDDISRLSSFDVMLWNRASPPGSYKPYNDTSYWRRCTPLISVNETYSDDVNGPVLYECDASSQFSFLAIRKNTTEAIVLAEVEGYEFEPAPPNYLQVRPITNNYSCVLLDWSTPVKYIRWRCNSSAVNGIWSDKTTNGSSTSCGHNSNSPVTCYVIAIDVGGISDAVAQSAVTSCSNPTSVTRIGLGNEQQINNIQLSVLISWQPSTSKCPLFYKYYSSSGGSWLNASQPQVTLASLNANKDYYIHVAAHNKDSSSNNVTYNFKTKEIVPYFAGSESMTLTAKSSSCVNATWSEPSYPNGDLDEYWISCNSPNENLMHDAGSRDAEICGFRPYTNVTCQIEAHNGAGRSSSKLTRSVLTECTAPEPVQFSLQETINGDQRTLMPNLIVEAEPNCFNITRFAIKTSLFASDEYSLTRFTINASLTNYEVTIFAINNKGQTSEPATQIVNPVSTPTTTTSTATTSTATTSTTTSTSRVNIPAIAGGVSAAAIVVVIIIVIVVLFRMGKINLPNQCCDCITNLRNKKKNEEPKPPVNNGNEKEDVCEDINDVEDKKKNKRQTAPRKVETADTTYRYTAKPNYINLVEDGVQAPHDEHYYTQMRDRSSFVSTISEEKYEDVDPPEPVYENTNVDNTPQSLEASTSSTKKTPMKPPHKASSKKSNLDTKPPVARKPGNEPSKILAPTAVPKPQECTVPGPMAAGNNEIINARKGLKPVKKPSDKPIVSSKPATGYMNADQAQQFQERRLSPIYDTPPLEN